MDTDRSQRVRRIQSAESSPRLTFQIETPNFSDHPLRLDKDQANTLSRCILILHAIIRQQDHSDATFYSWRANQTKQIKNGLFPNLEAHPNLHSLLARQSTSGVTLNFEMLLSELSAIWPNIKTQFHQDSIRDLISGYFPIALEIKSEEDSMRPIFDHARKFFTDSASN